MLQKKGMDGCQVDSVQPPFFLGNTECQKQIDVGRIRFNSVFGQSPFGDEIAKIQLESCGEVLWKRDGFDGASGGIRLLRPGIGCGLS